MRGRSDELTSVDYWVDSQNTVNQTSRRAQTRCELNEIRSWHATTDEHASPIEPMLASAFGSNKRMG
eukprot:5912643-Pleurochrysis_carterae.AAC.1